VSSITTDHGILHYEVYGRGRPVILLHGWLGSVGLWLDTMIHIGKFYRVYSIDFWGFGESGQKLDTYAVPDFVDMVHQFMDSLGMISAPLVGHSMGGTVSLSFALKYPEQVQNVTVIGSPIDGSSLALLLKLAGYRFNAFLMFKFFGLFRAFMYYFYSRLICKHPDFPKRMDDDLNQLSLESFLVSIATLRRTDLRQSLNQIQLPVMGMYGDKDLIVSPHQWKPLLAGVPHARIERFPKAGHFIMLDEPENFRDVLKDFLDKEIPSTR